MILFPAQRIPSRGGGTHRSTPQGWLRDQSFQRTGMEEEQACRRADTTNRGLCTEYEVHDPSTTMDIVRHSLSTGKTRLESLATPVQPMLLRYHVGHTRLEAPFAAMDTSSQVGWPPPWEVAPSYGLPDPDLGAAKSRLAWWTVWTPRPNHDQGQGHSSLSFPVMQMPRILTG
ncbi:hypothetical protein CSAL01_05417 [Colletotrichum salicis]|uniref:Uncharacterized protein n=1 Tax=Colletotrichum salicis TaxID=1209931 RepID=A0A135RRZ7_9PEZI|nr:hypothetical protein CSAL01_05417 [Colletotrichum salicis]